MPTSRYPLAARYALLCASLCIATAQAAVTIDGTLRPAATLAGPSYQINEAHGVRAGANLFHSFGQFSLATGESATFNGSAGIANIIGRVTGGALSSIDGSIISTVAGANLFLINPAGFLFGPNASLNVSGSFYASSASYVRLADNAVFHAVTPGASTLTAAAPAAFGFLGPAGPITVSGSRLAVPSGKALGLAGGDISIEGASPRLEAKGGTLAIAAVRSAGEVGINANGFDVSSITGFGSVDIKTGATFSVAEASGAGGSGRVFIRGGRILVDRATIDAQTAGGSGQGIDIAGTDQVTLSGTKVLAMTTGAGNAAPVSLAGRALEISSGSLIDTSCDPGCTTGVGGAIDLRATESIAIVGTATTAPSAVVSNTLGGGRTGILTLTAPSVSASGNALLQSATRASGSASGIVVSADVMNISGGAQLSSHTEAVGAGGSVTVNAGQRITITGTLRDPANPDALPKSSGLFANTFSSGAAGQITVNTGNLTVEGGGEISSSSGGGFITAGGVPAFVTTATGTGGRITIAASGIALQGTDAGGKASAIVTNTFGPGNAGAIDVNAASLTIRSGGRMQSQSEGSGVGGQINLTLGSLAVGTDGQISGDARGSGAGGSIVAVVSSGTTLTGANSGLFVKTYGAAPSGAVRLTTGRLDISNGAGIFAGSDGAGTGGLIDVTAGSVSITSGGQLSSRSAKTGVAGDIKLDAGAELRMEDSSITTEALLADGGNIGVRATRLISLLRSRITTAVGFGLGNGGNITIDPQFLVLNQSSIIANAFGGNGGNISITAGQFLRSPDSVVSASSQLGVSGTIVISSPPVDVSGSLAELPVSYLDAAALLTNPCAARLAGKASSLVLAGRGGVPYSGEGYLPLFPLSQPIPPLAAPGIQPVTMAEGIGAKPIVQCPRT